MRMRSVSMRLCVALGAYVLLALPVQGQTQQCQGGGSSTSASTTTTGTSSTGSTTSGVARVRLSQIQSQITQLQGLLGQLQSGQVSAAGTGLTNAQAAQVIQQRINALSQLAVQVSSSANAQAVRGQNQATATRGRAAIARR